MSLEERAGWFTLIVGTDVLWLFVLCYLCLPHSVLVRPAMCDCGIAWSYSLFCFLSSFTPGNQIGNLVQLFNAESHAIGIIMPVHGIDDAIKKYVFDKFVNRNGYVPDNIDTEWHIQFSYDNIDLLKATVDSKLFTLHCKEMMAWQLSSERNLCTTEQQTCKVWPSVNPFSQAW